MNDFQYTRPSLRLCVIKTRNTTLRGALAFDPRRLLAGEIRTTPQMIVDSAIINSDFKRQLKWGKEFFLLFEFCFLRINLLTRPAPLVSEYVGTIFRMHPRVFQFDAAGMAQRMDREAGAPDASATFARPMDNSS
jgi:hypothetical protein